jgi:hypothetical protein
MSRHTSYRGVTIDMDTMRRENEKSVALGNMRVNAKGDQIGRNGVIVKTADQIARDNHRTQTAILSTGLKGQLPASPATMEQKKVETKKSPVKATVSKPVEKELPNGDIVMEDPDNEKA